VSAQAPKVAEGRRAFMTATAIATATGLVKAQEKKLDGGLATIEDKQIPERTTPILPPGALSARNFHQHCTACQLCVQVCPNQVLRPSTGLMNLMQPEASYERGYCRPECTKCSEVCPAGAIRPIGRAEKSSIQVGHAVWIEQNCVVNTDGVSCGNCERHCPTGAIQMVPADKSLTRHPERGYWMDANGRRANMRDMKMIPAINTEKCIGCGSCEYLCPARPFSAIYVEGHEQHREI
jgi:ferredoxin